MLEAVVLLVLVLFFMGIPMLSGAFMKVDTVTAGKSCLSEALMNGIRSMEDGPV